MGWQGLDRNRVSAALETSRCVRLRIYFVDKRCYDYAVRLSHDVDIKYSVTVSSMTGKVELTLPKLVSNQWQSLGVVDTKVTRVASRIEAAPFIRKARLSRKIQVTHNVHLFSFTFPPGHIFHVPLGHHVQMKLTLKGLSHLLMLLFSKSRKISKNRDCLKYRSSTDEFI